MFSPPPALPSGAGWSLDSLMKRARLEWIDPNRRAANMVRFFLLFAALAAADALSLLSLTHLPSPTHQHQSLLRALGLFVGGVVVARNFGDAFNV